MTSGGIQHRRLGVARISLRDLPRQALDRRLERAKPLGDARRAFHQVAGEALDLVDQALRRRRADVRDARARRRTVAGTFGVGQGVVPSRRRTKFVF